MDADNVKVDTDTGRTPDVSEQALKDLVNAVLAGNTERFEEILGSFTIWCLFLRGI